MATEDHDLDEIRHVTFFQDGKLVKLELPGGVGNGAPVGRIPLGSEIAALLRTACDALGGAQSDLAQMLTASYGADDTYGSSFGTLFARLLGDSGLILLDPLDL